MTSASENLALLNDPVAKELLESAIPARLAYIGLDGLPRLVPIWFTWNGKKVVIGTPPRAPKVRALRQNPKVVLDIDSQTYPYRVLQIRGVAKVEIVDGLVPEYASAAERYFGPEAGKGWVEQVGPLFKSMASITITPEWVAILDFETRFPREVAKAMSGG